MHDEKGKPYVNTKYRIKRGDGSYEYGTTDHKGVTHITADVQAEALSIELLRGA